MKLSIVSDLHLEFAGCSDFPGGDILILAGDIWTVRHMETDEVGNPKFPVLYDRYVDFCRTELSKYEKVLVITGNHEPYTMCIEEMHPMLDGFLADHAPNAQYLDDNAVVNIADVHFLGTTLWSTCDVGKPNEQVILYGMNDFKFIRTRRPLPKGAVEKKVGIDRKWTPRDAAELHGEAVRAIEDFANGYDRCIVIGHHAPSFRSINDECTNTQHLNAAYCSNLDSLIRRHSNIDLWVHGHTHKCEDYQIGKTRIIANPRGYYPDERRARYFDPAAGDVYLDSLRKAA